MTDALKKKLISLADRYEVPEFTEGDPSQFLRWYEPKKGRGTVADVEVASFIAAMLAFGNRKQFIPKIREVLETSDRSLGSVSEWLKSGNYKKDFPRGAAKFYRFYSYDDMQTFFGEIADILKEAGSLGEFFRQKMNGGGFRGEAPRRRGSTQRSAGAGGDFPLIYYIFFDIIIQLQGAAARYNHH